MFESSDLFQLLDITEGEATLEKPMNIETILIYVTKKFEDQPLKYFNLGNGIRVIHLRSKTIMNVRLKIEFK